MNDKIILDTNLWIYLLSGSDEIKYNRIKKLLDQNFTSICLTTQILSELYSVLTRKNLKPKEEAKEILLELITNFPVIEIDAITIIHATEVNIRYSYSYWDSLLIATAITAEASVIYSEDMQHGQTIDDKVKIVNPFAP